MTDADNVRRRAGLVDVAQRHAAGGVCGTDAHGITNPLGLTNFAGEALALLAHFAGLESPNDGMVAWSSCELDKPWGTDFDADWYKAAVNHMDSCFKFWHSTGPDHDAARADRHIRRWMELRPIFARRPPAGLPAE